MKDTTPPTNRTLYWTLRRETQCATHVVILPERLVRAFDTGVVLPSLLKWHGPSLLLDTFTLGLIHIGLGGERNWTSWLPDTGSTCMCVWVRVYVYLGKRQGSYRKSGYSVSHRSGVEKRRGSPCTFKEVTFSLEVTTRVKREDLQPSH